MWVRRGASFIAAAIGAVLLGLVGVSWACTAQARIVATSPSSAPAQATVSVRGEAVTPGAPIEIRWDNVQGQKIGSSVADAQGNFTSAVTIPDVTPGIYSLVAKAGTEGLARTSFEVTSPVRSAAVAPSGTGSWSGRPTAVLDSSSGSGSSLGLAVGAGMLSLGLLGVFAAFALVALRRQKVPAGVADLRG